ncbi:MAG: transcription antitermination factor NusB [Tannerellaceae bacterium]|jgi:N utilization substance protein B|nr:transcription antitermination factor NusB [Tannerellaceae bacterium]
MINRILIRSKVLQIVYSFYQNGNGDIQTAEKELLFSLRKSYDLYHYLLLLILDLTYLLERMQDNKKNKLMPTAEDLNPNTRLLGNRFTRQLAENMELKKYIADNKISWIDDTDFLKSILDMLLASDLYSEYLENPEDSYIVDREFWRAFFKKYICGNEMVEDYLEDKSIYWNDDVEIIETFALKTIRKFEEQAGGEQSLLPMYRDMEDRDFAVRLLRKALFNGKEYRERIEKQMKNWETERIANMDLIIMQVAVAEILNFPTIPVSVSLNEYIDAAKYYSTPKSGTFINGILDSLVGELKKEKLLLKD